ncbi:MAG: histidine kinase [Bacteroidetes bacterium]|nr:histidine kinase [Bacteroidota bacterium]
MVRRCYLTACFVVLTLCLYAQHVTYIPQSLPPCFDTYFPKGSIKAMVQTDDGFLWLGTSIGLIRYDGYEFLMSNGPDSLWKENESVGVSAMCKDNKGNIWLGYLDAVGCYNTRTNIYKRYPFDKSIMSGVSNVYGIYAENDDVWFGCSGNGMVQLHVPTGKMCRYNIATKERFPYMSEIRIDKCNYVHEIKKRDKNNLWLASSEGLMSFNIQTHEITLMQPKPDPKNVDEYNVIALLPIGSKVWVGGWQSGVQCYDTLTKTWERFLLSKEANAEFIETVGALLPKGDHELWVGTGGYGLCTFNTITKEFNFLNADSMCTGMSKLFVSELLFNDAQQNLYVGFLNDFRFFKRNISMFEQYPLTSYSNRNSGSSEAACFYESDDHKYLLVGEMFAEGLECYNQINGDKRIVYYQKNGKGIKIDWADEFVKRDKDNVLLFCNEGVLNYNFNTGQLTQKVVYDTLTKLYMNYSVALFHSTDDGYLWMSSSKLGLVRYCFKDGNVKIFGHDDGDTTSLASHSINRSCPDSKGNVWFAYRNINSLGYLDAQTDKHIYFNNKGIEDKLENSAVTSMLSRYKNHILVSTYSGLIIFDTSKKKPVVKKIINKARGFTTSFIANAYQQNDSIIWIITDKGLYAYNILTDAFDIVTEDDGVKGLLLNVRQSNHHEIFICVSKSFYKVNQAYSISTQSPLASIITSFSINDKKINHALEIENNQQIYVTANYDYFTVSFASLDYRFSKDLKYSYMLEGLHKNWIDAGEKRYASFSGLNGGKYILKIKSTVNNGYSYSQITETPIYIETKYYKTLWFRTLIASLVCTLLLAIYRYRTKQKKEMDALTNRAQLLEKEKSVVQYENLVQQLNPHFLFNSLTSLSSLITIDPKTARQFVDQMSKIYRYLLKSSEHETVLLKEELVFAKNYVALQQTRFDKGFIVNFNVSEQISEKKIVPVTLQNLIENAIKHNIIDEEVPLIIDITNDADYIIIENNKQLKNVVESSNKRGLQQMQSLYKYMTDKPIVILSTDQKFIIKIPLL